MIDIARVATRDYRVGRTVVHGVVVSTVDVTFGQAFRSYETLIFGGPYDQDGRRYATRDAAALGHAQIVANLRAGQKPL